MNNITILNSNTGQVITFDSEDDAKSFWKDVLESSFNWIYIGENYNENTIYKDAIAENASMPIPTTIINK